MKYLKSFSKQLRFFRETHKLGLNDVANLCNVDESVVGAWEQGGANPVYPTLENLLDICFKTGASLEYFIDLPVQGDLPQLELPGLVISGEPDDLGETLDALDKQLDAALPKEQELELIKRFRKSDEQNRSLILQLMGM
jgi:transcriptional regulator with XRE-family HTH domain